MEALQLWRWVGAQLLSEESARLVVGNQGVGLASGGIQRAHVQASKTLVQRVGGDQRFQLRNQTGVGAAGELRLDPVAGRVQPELLGAQDVGRSEVCQRFSTPERQSSLQQLGGPAWITGGQRRPPLGEKP